MLTHRYPPQCTLVLWMCTAYIAMFPCTCIARVLTYTCIPVKTWLKSTVGSIGQCAFVTGITGSERHVECKICIANARAINPWAVTISSIRTALARLHEGKEDCHEEKNVRQWLLICFVSLSSSWYECQHYDVCTVDNKYNYIPLSNIYKYCIIYNI